MTTMPAHSRRVNRPMRCGSGAVIRAPERRSRSNTTAARTREHRAGERQGHRHVGRDDTGCRCRSGRGCQFLPDRGRGGGRSCHLGGPGSGGEAAPRARRAAAATGRRARSRRAATARRRRCAADRGAAGGRRRRPRRRAPRRRLRGFGGRGGRGAARLLRGLGSRDRGGIDRGRGRDDGCRGGDAVGRPGFAARNSRKSAADPACTGARRERRGGRRDDGRRLGDCGGLRRLRRPSPFHELRRRGRRSVSAAGSTRATGAACGVSSLLGDRRRAVGGPGVAAGAARQPAPNRLPVGRHAV